jgi:hypothetical protein
VTKLLDCEKTQNVPESNEHVTIIHIQNQDEKGDSELNGKLAKIGGKTQNQNQN